VYDTSNFIPPQVPPIDRTPSSGAAAFTGQSRVDASMILNPFGTGWPSGPQPGCLPGQSLWECLGVPPIIA
jgi:hypothetical protein